jgi:hypothetical protein
LDAPRSVIGSITISSDPTPVKKYFRDHVVAKDKMIEAACETIDAYRQEFYYIWKYHTSK